MTYIWAAFMAVGAGYQLWVGAPPSHVAFGFFVFGLWFNDAFRMLLKRWNP